MQPGPIIASSVERAFWRWAEDNANDPDSIEVVSIEGPRKCDEGPLYQVKTREPFLGQKVLNERHFIIVDGVAREPQQGGVRAMLKYRGFEYFDE
ncbi:hypothetical protein [Aeoliella sp. SH292]|uniref:hypothetical protein n=1 Tax=Aeoliella sp. SH292 TaxID=3454464 RepID=UPI003F9ADC7F